MTEKIYQWAGKEGVFKRQISSFREFISDDKEAKFKPEPFILNLILGIDITSMYLMLVLG